MVSPRRDQGTANATSPAPSGPAGPHFEPSQRHDLLSMVAGTSGASGDRGCVDGISARRFHGP